MFESEFLALLGRRHHHHHLLLRQQEQQQQQTLALPIPPPPFPSAASAPWSRHEDKVFETALVNFPEGSPDRWFHIASQLPGKDPGEVLDHYRALQQDIHDIDSGRIPPPDYGDADDDNEEEEDEEESASGDSGARRQISFGGKAKEERKKGVPWTEEEHRRFLEGLEKFGKGDWRSISRNAVVTRTPTQVASHAQKYFIRLNSMGKKEKKRGSIHDITKP